MQLCPGSVINGNALMHPPVKRFLKLRRSIFFLLVLLTTLSATGLLQIVFQKDGLTPLELALLVLYTILFVWISFSFWTAVLGFITCLTGCDRYSISTTTLPQGHKADTDKLSKTALIIPIYNEEAKHVFARLKTMLRSLQKTGQQSAFDVFILSDTRDPDIWIEEELLWNDLNQHFEGEAAIYYRNRQDNQGRKSGNIADFCERWGSHYEYMIVCDADSVMAGSTLVQMVRMMERNPGVGLIQVPPAPVNRESLFARIQQFASSVYGRIFTAGLNFWQLSEANYWGHNAIIRIKPFIEHCGLPVLPGSQPFGGEILSHDFVEAALLRRAGWEIWLAYDIAGSYEEIPPTLIDYAKRDRRWCQGNLQHLSLIFARGLHPLSRLHFIMGIMSYLASPLWLLFLVLTGIEAYFQSTHETIYFFENSLFPVWPTYYTVEMTTVLAVTLAMLFLPKLLALILVLREPESLAAHGGSVKVILSVVLESLFSMLLAPVMMLFQSRFVFAILLRRDIGWTEQQRDDHHTGFSEAIVAHGGHTLIGLMSAYLTYQYAPSFFWWFVPVLIGLTLSIPLSVYSSSTRLGKISMHHGLFLIPEETVPPEILRNLYASSQAHLKSSPDQAVQPRSIQAIVNPGVHALHTALLAEIPRSRKEKHYLKGLSYQYLEDGEASLNKTELRDLLSDKATLKWLHALVWSRAA